MSLSPSLARKRGQNTAEYLIMLTLVAVGSIALVTLFGKTIQGKIAQVTAAISGDNANYTVEQNAAKTTSGQGNTRVTAKLDMSGVQQSDLQSN